MEPNLMNYGYPPTYHQLQGQTSSFDQIQPISHLSPEIPLLSNGSGIQHQTVSSTQSSSSSDFSDQFVLIKTEDDEEKLQQQQQTTIHPQRPQYLPSIFNTHPYQSMAPISWENNFNYHQYQYNTMAYHHHQLPPLDHRLMQQSPISYSGAAMHHHAYASNGTLPSFQQQQQQQQLQSPLYDEAIQNSPNMEMGIHSSEQQQQQQQLQQLQLQQQPININEGFYNTPSVVTISTNAPHQVIKSNSSFYCNPCDRHFTTTTHYKRHLETKTHKLRAPTVNISELSKNEQIPVLIKRGNQSIQITISKQHNPITDLSDAEVVLINKFDNELYEIEKSTLDLGGSPVDKKDGIVTNLSPVQATTSSASSCEGSNSSSEFSCQLCNKTFAKKCYLTQHNKTAHIGVKPHKCIKCGKKYETSEALDMHMTKHGDNKPFKCAQCPKAFVHKTDLKRHIILHTSEKPHACEQCGKKFIRKDHLMKHIHSHQKKKERMQRIISSALN